MSMALDCFGAAPECFAAPAPPQTQYNVQTVLTRIRFMGAMGIDIGNDDRGNVVVSRLYPGQQAIQAGVQKGFIITGVNDVAMANIRELGDFPVYADFAAYVQKLPKPVVLNFNETPNNRGVDAYQNNQSRGINMPNNGPPRINFNEFVQPPPSQDPQDYHRATLVDLMFDLLDKHQNGTLSESEVKAVIGAQSAAFWRAVGVQAGQPLTKPIFQEWVMREIVKLLPDRVVGKLSSIFAVSLVRKHTLRSGQGDAIAEPLYNALDKDRDGFLDIEKVHVTLCAEEGARSFFDKMEKTLSRNGEKINRVMFVSYVEGHKRECMNMLNLLEAEARRGVVELCATTASRSS